MTQLSNKVIINQQVLSQLRQSIEDFSEFALKRDFLSQLDALLNDHLRGLDFQVKRQVRSQIIEQHFKAEQKIELTYYDVAKILMDLPLPTKQVVSNFQNWILMSTEYNLPFADVIRVCLEEEFDNSAQWQDALEIEVGPVAQAEEILQNQPLQDQSLEDEPLQPADEEALPLIDVKPKPAYRIRYGMIGLYCLVLIGIAAISWYGNNRVHQARSISFADASSLVATADPTPAEIKVIVNIVAAHHSEGYPEYLAFEPVNRERLQGYLKRKNSLLAEEPYFSTIMNTCAAEDVHPVLLFAIAGQEQGFVKRGSENAALIVNNPFNVYHSWVEYNTDLKDSSRVAAITIKSALANRPKGENAFKWLNKTYAEDSKWWSGTEQIFMSIEEYLGPYHMNRIQ